MLYLIVIDGELFMLLEAKDRLGACDFDAVRVVTVQCAVDVSCRPKHCT